MSKSRLELGVKRKKKSCANTTARRYTRRHLFYQHLQEKLLDEGIPQLCRGRRINWRFEKYQWGFDMEHITIEIGLVLSRERLAY